MANVNNPHGLRPLYVLSGGPVQTELFSKAVGLDTPIYPFDAVLRLADGSITSKAGDANPGTLAYSGVALDYGAASKATSHIVIVGYDTVFEAQGDDATSIDAVDMGLNCNLVLTLGDSVTKLSKHCLDSSTKDVTNSLDVHLMKLLAVPDNDYGAYARVEFLFNKHRLQGGVAGI